MLTSGSTTSTAARPTARANESDSPRSVTTRRPTALEPRRAPGARPRDREHDDDEHHDHVPLNHNDGVGKSNGFSVTSERTKP